MSNLERNTNFESLFGIVVTITIAMMLIIGSSFPDISLGKSSSRIASNSGGGVGTGNSGSSVSNLHGIHNQSSSSHLYFAPPPPSSAPGINIISNKLGMIGFDDSYKSQILYAKPILDKYGFKASFFEVCTWIGKTKDRQTWQDIAILQHDGMDIESHTMTHAHLPTLLSSPNKLTYEIAGSKQCLTNHGVNATIFGYPLNLGSDNPSIVNVVAKYYSLARSGSAPLMFLNCNGYVKQSQNDCSTYSPNGKLTYANRYDIKSDSFRHIDSNHNYSPSQEFQKFVQRMNSQIPYNINGKINAIPIITYHNLTNSMQDYNNMASTITVDLFAQQMKYLHDNGFRVLLLNQLGYDPNNNVFHIKNVS
ncbi:MAG: polysaccharide deacetylase family protein [Candidatus Nitrosopolaris sp.]